MKDLSENCLVLLGSESRKVQSLVIADDLKTLILPVDSLTKVDIHEVVQREGVTGLLATTPQVLSATNGAAELHGLPMVPPQAVTALLSRSRLLDMLTDAGINVPEYAHIGNPEEAQVQSRNVPGPWRVLSDNYGVNVLERYALHSEDLPLAYSSVTKGLERKDATVESELEGTSYVVCGMLNSGRFTPGAIFHQKKARENDVVPMSIDLIPDIDTSISADIADFCQGALEAIGIESGLWELELVAIDAGLHLTHIHPTMVPSAPVQTLLRAGHMEQLMSHAFFCSIGTTRLTKPPPPQAVAMQWLSIRSGVVRKIEGVEEAKELDGVAEIHIGVKPGDVIGHIRDRRARNALGHVVASATKTCTAAENAERARARIHIQTGAIH